MNNKSVPTVIENDVVVTMDYELLVDGELIDSSQENGPIDFLQGHENIVPGLERELYGLKVGDSVSVTVSPEDGYGEYDDDAVIEVPRSEFPNDFTPEPGMELEVRDEENELHEATILDVTDDVVILDFNDPLAGETLQFHVTILELRAATTEELEHGHVHDAGHEH